MKWQRICSCWSILGLCLTTAAFGQKPAAPPPLPATSSGQFSMGELKPTPEMWFYEQYRQGQQDPKTAVRANAEFRAEQRQRRLAASRWFGLSNLRPRAAVDPLHSDFSPGWSSGDPNYPFRWSGAGNSMIIIQSQ